MEVIFIGAAAILLTLVIVWSLISQAQRIDSLEEKVTLLVGDTQRAIELTTSNFGKVALKDHQHGDYNEFNAHVGKFVEETKGRLDRVCKESEVMIFRQRTLEKKIVGMAREVTVYIEDKPKTKKGRGAGALIKGADL